MKYSLPLLFLMVSCMSGNEKLVREHLETNMKISQSNLEIEKIELGEKVMATPEVKQGLALLGMKDSFGYPLKVTFKAKEDCVAIAEAIKNDVLFQEKKVSCRPVKAGEEPNLKYVKAYNFGVFGRKIAVYEEGKLIKAGETFTADGELVTFVSLKDEEKTGTMFKGLK